MFRPCQNGVVESRESRAFAMSTDVYSQKFSVPFEYPVYFTHDVLDLANPTLARALTRMEPDRCHRAVVVIDDGVVEAWPKLWPDLLAYTATHSRSIELVGLPEIVDGGERAKNDPAWPTRIQTRLQELSIDRHAFVLIIGGGAVLDMVGYAAATTHRGVRVIRLPTTVLSQADGGVGVKNGVNAFGTKNFLGTFSPPFAVINDIRFIGTLSPRDRIAGMAEAVKVSLIRDAEYFEWLIGHADELSAFEHSATASMIRRCAELHLTHIANSGDPFETGSARPLDFGHWAAHKIEALSGNRLRHGEAVAIGLAIDARYSVEVGVCPSHLSDSICDLLEQLGFRLWDEVLDLVDADGIPAVLDGLAEFQEHLGGLLTLTLVDRIGHTVETTEIDRRAMVRAIDWLRSRESRL